MNRRQFLGAAAAATAGATAASIGSSQSIADTAKPPASSKPDSLAEPPPGVPYFTQERLEASIDTSGSLDGIDFTAVTFVCNLWHPSPVLEKWFGKGFSEWEICRRAKALYEGHYQPKRPLWGCYKEAEPEWAAREIDLAASAGLDVFMVDWYWHSGEMFLHEWLEDAFLKAPNCEKMKFALMWANHHWTNMYLAPEQGEEAILLPQTYSDADMDRLCGYLIDHYFTQPNYWKIDGKPVFGTFWTGHLINHFTPAGLRKIFDGWESRARKAGLNGIHFQTCDLYDQRTPLLDAGFASATRYHPYAGGGKTNRTPWAEGAQWCIKQWHDQSAELKVPYFPNCPVGWDNSPRYGRNAKVFVNRSADQFERLLVAAKHFVAQKKLATSAVYMGAWNEWTEDHYLLPDEVYGYSYLEAVRQQFGT
jgi:hypothetical protein